MIPQWIIEKKRDGGIIADADIREFVSAYTDGQLPDYQMAAFAMAVFFRGMSFGEVTTLTDAMMRSGDLLDWSDLQTPTADKHSTGGIGDKISIALAPLAASCGCAVPMISGRGLGITGGTLDKLESIPGYNSALSVAKFKKILKDTGCSIIGQTARLAPADKKLYALRDVTGTVQSIPLIAASIMSKKLAEGADALVLDVKCGAGAFMKKRAEAEKLARTMIAVGKNMGRRVSAIITDMDEPIGRTVGNTLEIEEAIEILKNRGPDDTRELTVELSAEMLVLSGVAPNRGAALSLLNEKLASGAALETFARMVAAHGGNAQITEDYSIMRHAPYILEVPASRSGFVSHVDADAIGRTVLLLGGGRRKTTDAVNHGVGVDRLVKRGDRVETGAPLMRIFAASASDADAVASIAAAAVSVSDEPAAPRPILLDRISG